MSSDSIGRALSDAVPGVEASTSELDRLSYARDLWPRHHLGVKGGVLPPSRPALVVWPKTTEEVAAIVRRCAEEGAPIAPFGAGSGVCGGTLPDPRTVIVDLKKLARVRSLGGDVLDVEAGAMGIRLEEDLDARGHTLGHFPSSILCSTVGGWIAARSAGQCSGLYGKIEDMVVSLECVLGRGEVVRLKRRLHGPDATPLIVGSEGIFGVVTAAELRLHARPDARGFAAYSFPSVVHGWEAMRELFQAGLRPAVARLYDAFDSFMAKRGAVRSHDGQKKKARSGLGRSLRDAAMRALLRQPSLMNALVDRAGDRAFGGAMLVLVFEGDAANNLADLDKTRHIVARHGASALGEAPAQHWFKHRYAVSYRQAPVFMSGSFSDTMEVATTWSRLEQLYEGVRRAMSPHVFVMAHLSHAYPDGCSIYFTFAGSAPTREQAEARYDQTWSAAMEAVLAAGGTLSHHHGVGRSKAPKLGAELGLGVQVVRALGQVLDPAGIFNPGNLLPKESPTRPLRPTDLPPARAPRFDEASLLVLARGESTLGAIEDLAHARGYTLGIDGLAPDTSVAAYLAAGAPGARDAYDDPADHLVAGFTARLRSGDELVVHPGPRRAVGPDLYALFHGCGEAVGAVTSAHLRVHRLGMQPRALSCAVERDPAPSGEERELLARLHGAAASASWA